MLLMLLSYVFVSFETRTNIMVKQKKAWRLAFGVRISPNKESIHQFLNFIKDGNETARLIN